MIRNDHFLLIVKPFSKCFQNLSKIIFKMSNCPIMWSEEMQLRSHPCSSRATPDNRQDQTGSLYKLQMRIIYDTFSRIIIPFIKAPAAHFPPAAPENMQLPKQGSLLKNRMPEKCQGCFIYQPGGVLFRRGQIRSPEEQS